MRRMWLVGCVLVIVGCTGGGDDDGGGGSGSENCALTVQIQSATCRFVDNPDPFDTDWWYVDMTGTATGFSTEHTSTQFYVKQIESSYAASETCAAWTNCITMVGGPESTTWMGTITNFAPTDMSSMTFTVQAISTKFGSTYCQTPTSVAEMPVTCTR